MTALHDLHLSKPGVARFARAFEDGYTEGAECRKARVLESSGGPLVKIWHAVQRASCAFDKKGKWMQDNILSAHCFTCTGSPGQDIK